VLQAAADDIQPGVVFVVKVETLDAVALAIGEKLAQQVENPSAGKKRYAIAGFLQARSQELGARQVPETFAADSIKDCFFAGFRAHGLLVYVRRGAKGKVRRRFLERKIAK
jgi:hypothetical protein